MKEEEEWEQRVMMEEQEGRIGGRKDVRKIKKKE